jgi:hypothetical protein
MSSSLDNDSGTQSFEIGAGCSTSLSGSGNLSTDTPAMEDFVEELLVANDDDVGENNDSGLEGATKKDNSKRPRTALHRSLDIEEKKLKLYEEREKKEWMTALMPTTTICSSSKHCCLKAECQLRRLESKVTYATISGNEILALPGSAKNQLQDSPDEKPGK